jgi:hypothetical protein
MHTKTELEQELKGKQQIKHRLLAQLAHIENDIEVLEETINHMQDYQLAG